MEIVNAVYKTRLAHSLDVYRLSGVIPNSILYVGRPTQLKVMFAKQKITCLLFGRGAIRIMGKGVAEAISTSSSATIEGVLAYVLSHITNSSQSVLPPPSPTLSLELQKMTIVTNLPGPINLNGFVKACDGGDLKPTYDFELFSAVKLTNFKPVCVNVFSSGKIIMCGIKDIECADNIFSTIMVIYNIL